MSDKPQGFARLMIAAYAVFALSATGRSLYQLATKAGEAPVAYSLSAAAAVVYILATWGLATRRHRVALWAIGFELVGVVTVGLVSITGKDLLHAESVWSGFGAGYGYVPLVLPFIGLWWLLRTKSSASSR